MTAHRDDLELVIEIIHDESGNNPRAHYRLFVGGHPVEYSELTGVKNILAQALVSHILAARMASLKNAGATPDDLPGPPPRH